MKVLQIRAFGRLQMQYGSKMVTSFPTHHVEELLGYFLLHQGVTLAREKIITLLWPCTSAEKARGRFSTTLWRLRTLFDAIDLSPQSCLQAGREWITFSPDPSLQLDIDITTFTRHITQAQFAADETTCEQSLKDALALYKGELYEGIYADWCLLERERLARLHLRALGQLMVAYMQRHAYEAAVDLGRRILHEDPLREEVHRALMHCYWQTGQHTRALQQFQLCSQALIEELHILPMVETIELYRHMIEERWQTVHCQTHDERLQNRLQTAFTQFTQAGERLNALMDGTT